MEKAKHDITYCVSNECADREKCTIHCSHYEFDLTKNYWYMQQCEDFKKEGIKDE